MNSSRRLPLAARTGLLAAFIVLVCAGPAFAQDEVEVLNEEGIRAFQEQRFAEAADKFRQAYALAPEPTLKKNEAIAWFKGGDCENAVTAAKSYLALEGQDEASTREADSVVARCSAKLAREAIAEGNLDQAGALLAQAEGKTVDEDASRELGEARAELEQAERDREMARLQARREAEERERAQREEQEQSSPMLGYALTGAGGGLLLVAITYHVAILATTVPEYRRVGAEGDDRERFDTLAGRIRTARWLVPTLYALGGATAGVGVYFLVSPGEQSVSSNSTSSGPSVALGIHGRF